MARAAAQMFICWLMAGGVCAAANLPRVGVTVEQCSGRFDRAALSAQIELETATPPTRWVRVRIVCGADDTADLAIVDGGVQIERTLRLGDLAADAQVRVIALAAAELLRRPPHDRSAAPAPRPPIAKSDRGVAPTAVPASSRTESALPAAAHPPSGAPTPPPPSPPGSRLPPATVAAVGTIGVQPAANEPSRSRAAEPPAGAPPAAAPTIAPARVAPLVAPPSVPPSERERRLLVAAGPPERRGWISTGAAHRVAVGLYAASGLVAAGSTALLVVGLQQSGQAVGFGQFGSAWVDAGTGTAVSAGLLYAGAIAASSLEITGAAHPSLASDRPAAPRRGVTWRRPLTWGALTLAVLGGGIGLYAAAFGLPPRSRNTDDKQKYLLSYFAGGALGLSGVGLVVTTHSLFAWLRDDLPAAPRLSLAPRRDGVTAQLEMRIP